MSRFLSAYELGAIAFAVVAILVASFLVAKTPGWVLGDDVLGDRGATAGSRNTVDYKVRDGATAASIGSDLEGLGVIRSSRQFQVLLALMGLQDQLSAGDHRLKTGSSVSGVIDLITVKAGETNVLRVTFPEGIRIEEMAERAEAAGFGSKDDFLKAAASAKPPPGLTGVIPAGQSLQGYLFPDTYIMPMGSTPAELVDFMLETFAARFTPALQAAVEARGLTVHQAVTLASIVEREAVVSDERARIAGVFLNRVKAGDALGADPTVQFALAQDPKNVEEFGWWKLELTVEDLEVASPYNTRKVAGIPPGPITNPGLASLEAVARPEETSFYYFVADAKKGDGSHRFAVTLDEHLQNQALYGSP